MGIYTPVSKQTSKYALKKKKNSLQLMLSKCLKVSLYSMDFPVRGQVRGSLCLLVQILFAAADLLSADILTSGPRIQVLCRHCHVGPPRACVHASTFKILLYCLDKVMFILNPIYAGLSGSSRPASAPSYMYLAPVTEKIAVTSKPKFEGFKTSHQKHAHSWILSLTYPQDGSNWVETLNSLLESRKMSH